MMKSFDDAGLAGKELVNNTLKSYAAVSKGLQTIATEAADYSKKAFETNSAMFEEFLSARSFEKALELQSSHAKRAYEEFVAEASKMSELYADLAKEAYKPFETPVAKTAAPKQPPQSAE